jgi:hypothetical protein
MSDDNFIQLLRKFGGKATAVNKIREIPDEMRDPAGEPLRADNGVSHKKTRLFG